MLLFLCLLSGLIGLEATANPPTPASLSDGGVAVPDQFVDGRTAPGCDPRNKEIIGGCFGKTLIVVLNVEPAIKCLSVSVNNCNGGVLEIRNRCDQPLLVGDLQLPGGARSSVSVELMKGSDGDTIAVRASGNYASYVPPADERLAIWAEVGRNRFRISYTKTAKLCP